jgi:hypothetical protein
MSTRVLTDRLAALLTLVALASGADVSTAIAGAKAFLGQPPPATQ